MKIIDFDKKGNSVRFYLGKDKLTKYSGDCWDRTPYEHNAGQVLSEFVSGHTDVVFPFDWEVLEPQDDWRYNGNSPYCKDDFVKRHAPCIIAVPPEIAGEYWGMVDYSQVLGNDNVIKFYFGDALEQFDATVLYRRDGKLVNMGD